MKTIKKITIITFLLLTMSMRAEVIELDFSDPNLFPSTQSSYNNYTEFENNGITWVLSYAYWYKSGPYVIFPYIAVR